MRDGLLTTAGALGTVLVWGRLRASRDRPWAARWERTNHAGRPVTLLEGVGLVAGTAGTAALTGAAWPGGALPYAVASLGAGSLGAVDDLRQDTDRKGLGGHLKALAQGRVTTGALKVVGLVATGLVVMVLADARTIRDDARTIHGDARACVVRAGEADSAGRPQARGTGLTTVWGTLAGAAVVAGSANLANLFDLRPGRALKVGVLTAVPLVTTGPGSPAAAVTLGAVLALLPDDLAGVSMLGDTGANPLGAVLGLALVQRQRPPARTLTLLLVTALTLASEKVSFTTVIESTPVLRELDALGREPR